MQGAREIEHATPDFPEGTVGTTVPITEIRNIPSYRGTSLYHGTRGYCVSLLWVPWYLRCLPGSPELHALFPGPPASRNSPISFESLHGALCAAG